MSYKFINSRQILNNLALSNIGSPSNDNLADILSKINAVLGSISGGSSYYAQQATLASGSTSIAVSVPTQQDTSYIVLAMMGNLIDSFPQYQQVEVTAKSPTGFTFSWNHPLDSSNYFISYIVPYKIFPEAESAIGSGSDTLSSTLFISQATSNYPVIAQLQNLTDANPQFQTTVIGNNSTTAANFSWNVDTDSSNYLMTYGILGTGQVTVANGVTSATLPLPVNFDSDGYALIATIQNTSDSFPQYQPLLITAQSGIGATVSWSIPTDVSSYLINYYAITLTA